MSAPTRAAAGPLGIQAPGPRSRRLAELLRRFEAPGINTLFDDQPGLVWESASGCRVVDVDGHELLDLTSGLGVAACGHRHPEIVAAVRRQCETLLHGLADVSAHPSRIALAQRLSELAPIPRAQVYWAASGSDAVEVALKTALLATGRPGVVAFEPSYHGVTLGALQATTRASFRQPFRSHFHACCRHLPYGCEPDLLAARLAERPAVGAVIVEPIVGREGVVVPPAGWLAAVADACHRNGALLVVDEILTGFGRAGVRFLSAELPSPPDLVCCGKALGGGLPIAAVLGGRDLLSVWRHPGEARHTATFVAHPLACAAALAFLEICERDDLPGRAARFHELVASRLDTLRGLNGVRDVRGRGLLWGIELSDAARARHVLSAMLADGVLALAGGADGRTLQLMPPLVIGHEDLESALAVVASAVASQQDLEG